jgi:hypothetical protein
VISQGKMLIHGTKMSLISLANVFAERIGDTKARAGQYNSFSLGDRTLPDVHISWYIFNLHAWTKWEEVFEMLNIGGESRWFRS